MEQIATVPSLNPGQQQVHDTLLEYLLKPRKSSPHPWWLIKGYAGTGKTFTISRVINSLRAINPALQIVMSAPTHKAVKVLRKNGSSEVDYATIHSLYGLKPVVDEHGGQKFTQSFDPKQLLIESYQVLILDEVSMLNLELFTYIQGSMKNDGLKVIFMGDPVQIPPVVTDKSSKEEASGDSEVLLRPEAHNIGVLELTQVVRQASDNPILAYATELRKVYKDGIAHPSSFAKDENGDGMRILRGDGEVDVVLDKYFKDPQFLLDADYMKVIAWTNQTVDRMNARIRHMMYGERSLEPILVGEKLVMDAPFTFNKTTGERLKTNDELVVRSVSMIDHQAHATIWAMVPNSLGGTSLGRKATIFRIPCFNLQVEYEDYNFTKKLCYIQVIRPDGLKAFQEAQNALKRSATVDCPGEPNARKEAWKQFYKFKDEFAYVKYNYAITAHKSQGSTYTNVISIEGDINKNRKTEERNRIKYVAATRAKKMLYIIP